MISTSKLDITYVQIYHFERQSVSFLFWFLWKRVKRESSKERMIESSFLQILYWLHFQLLAFPPRRFLNTISIQIVRKSLHATYREKTLKRKSLLIFSIMLTSAGSEWFESDFGGSLKAVKLLLFHVFSWSSFELNQDRT